MARELGERVVVIQEASRDLSSSAIRGILQGLTLIPGDSLKFLSVLHQVNNPMGYKIRLDMSSMFRTNQKVIKEEISKRKEEYRNNEEIDRISKLFQAENIEFGVEVRPGSSLKSVAVKVAKKFKATWVILDRHIKERSYFMENLSCKISRMKKDNSMELLRRQKAIATDNRSLQVQDFNNDGQFSYDEMIPGSPSEKKYSTRRTQNPHKPISSEERDEGVAESQWQNNKSKRPSFPKSSSTEQLLTVPSAFTAEASSSSAGSKAKRSPSAPNEEEEEEKEEEDDDDDDDDTFSIDLNKAYKASSPDRPDQETQKQVSNNKESWKAMPDQETQKQVSNNKESWKAMSPSEAFENSICSDCQNRRPKIGWKRDFTYAELQAATRGFSAKNYLSEGGFGSVFRGEINGLVIAVKQYKDASCQGEKEFKSEVRVLSKARHENLVMLLGSCSEGNRRLLVYEYVCNGSLDQHLSKHARAPLNWKQRLKIALGAAKGLQYLHENNIIHRDMRPNNILVTHDFESLLGDFGLAKTQREDSDYSTETGVVGTLGYLAPEYVECGKLSTKTDVYSFGVVLLQLITGRKTNDKKLEASLVGWARPLLKDGNYPDLIDPRITDCHDVHQLLWMVRVADKCLSKDPQKRLPMAVVVDALTYIMEGNATSSIRGFSPATSDYGSSSYCDSSESPPESPSQSDDTAFSVETISTSSMHLRFPPTPPAKTHQKHPPSPPRRSTIFAQKRRDVLYDEMII